jgi:hypothetical protein
MALRSSSVVRQRAAKVCEAHGVHYVFGLARNPRLEALIADEMAQAEAKAKDSGKPERLFKELNYQTLNSWSCERRVVTKAEHLPKGENPRFIIASLASEAVEARSFTRKSTAPAATWKIASRNASATFSRTGPRRRACAPTS